MTQEAITSFLVDGASEPLLSALEDAVPNDAKAAAAKLLADEEALAVATPDVLRALLATGPGLAEVPGVFDRLPLHRAALVGASVESLQVLLDAFPEAALARDRSKETPLHLALTPRAFALRPGDRCGYGLIVPADHASLTRVQSDTLWIRESCFGTEEFLTL